MTYLIFIILISVIYLCFKGLNKQNKNNDCYHKNNDCYHKNNDCYHKENTSKNDNNISFNRKYTDNVKQQIKEGKVIYSKTSGKPKYIEYNPDNLEIDPPKYIIEEIPHDPSYPVRRLGVKYDAFGQALKNYILIKNLNQNGQMV